MKEPKIRSIRFPQPMLDAILEFREEFDPQPTLGHVVRMFVTDGLIRNGTIKPADMRKEDWTDAANSAWAIRRGRTTRVAENETVRRRRK